jgi:hypothetical protein
MRTLVALPALLCAVVLTGCGSDTPAGSGPAHSSGTTTAAGASSAKPAGDRVASVVLRRSGGLKPTPVTRVFTAAEAPPKGYSADDLARVLRAAQALVDSHQKIRPLPASTCCDRFVYSVSIRLNDGTTKSYSTVDGLSQPRIFQVLLSRLS